jgi:(1->4)-alpha-D-glucan 1-alpha-D-glucosylmutase
MNARRQTPRATYRLQLHPGFDFDQAIEVLDYLRALGITHCYLAPYLSSTPESFHGYDVVDPTSVRADLGGEAGHARLCAALKARGLEQMVDVVPNHMGIDSEHNLWWHDVLARGPHSEYERYFDIDWQADAQGKLVLPVLPMEEQAALESSYIRLERDQHGRVMLRVGARALPLREGSLAARTAAEVEALNRSPQALASLLAQQHYRLAYYRTGLAGLNYRRFLDISSLAALRMEDAQVFERCHARIVEWVEQGHVSAIRVDHPDGLTDPEGYFAMLRAAAPSAWVVGEKVHAPGEWLPENWALDGTTGYEFLNLANGLFVHPEGVRELDATWAAFSGRAPKPFERVLRECKELALRELLTPEVRRVAALVVARAEPTQACAALSLAQRALCALTLALDVGRSYARPAEALSTHERAEIERAAARAAEREPELAQPLRELSQLLVAAPVDELVLRFQQLSSAVMAKALEDTAFYRYLRLTSLNEIGGHPERAGHSLREFHRLCVHASVTQPLSLLCTSTHDTKRAEDTRLRISALSELPGSWRAAVESFRALNHKLVHPLVDRDTEYLLYQTLVGSWPISEARLGAYMLKAVREAKLLTSWLTPNADYEAAVLRLVHDVLENADFLGALEQLLVPVLRIARLHSLTQTLLKVTCPGIPDVYQGTELWDTSLVDPDNRRPVDFALRARLLAQLEQGLSPEHILARLDEGLPKLWVLSQGLKVRAERRFSLAPSARYEPVSVHDDAAERVIAFLRGDDVLVVGQRFAHGAALETPTLTVPPGTWLNRLTGETVTAGEQRIACLLARFPVALLVRA